MRRIFSDYSQLWIVKPELWTEPAATEEKRKADSSGRCEGDSQRRPRSSATADSKPEDAAAGFRPTTKNPISSSSIWIPGQFLEPGTNPREYLNAE